MGSIILSKQNRLELFIFAKPLNDWKVINYWEWSVQAFVNSPVF